jgi:serine/threonine protein kinase
MWAGEEFYQMKLRLQHDGRTFDLNGLKQLGSGGEAIVYSLNGTPWAAKVYSKLVSGRDEKLRVMLANPPKDPTSAQGHVSIAWPQDLVIDQQGRIVGYVMPQVEQMRRMFDFYNPGTRRKKCPLFTYKYLVATALNLAIAVRALHQRGYVMGDVNESNFLVADNTMVTLVDTDSFQVREPGNGRIHHCTVASPLFTPREMQGVDFTIALRREEQDLFGFGVLLFQLLMEGSHPFQARFTGAGDSPEPIEMIRLGNFPHGTGSAMWQPPPVAPAFGMLDPKLRALFTRCFVNGHRDPKARPTADEWCANLKETLGILIHCKVNPSHLHWPHITRCPWCERKEKLGGRDPFPHPDQVRSGAHVAKVTSSGRSPISSTAGAVNPTARQPAPTLIKPVSPPSQNPSFSSTHSSIPKPTPTPAVPWWKRIIGAGTSNANPVRAAVNPVKSSSPIVVPKPTTPSVGPLAGADARILAQAKAGDLRTANIGSGISLVLCGIPANKPFWIGQTQVTQGQWQQLMKSNPSKFKGENLPVEQVSWDEAVEFCYKLSALQLLPAGWKFCLPTDQQWEYACRAGTTDKYAGTLSQMAWYSNNSQGRTHDVATKNPNSWGVYDMHGNVWEWCDGNAVLRETRGGSWNSGPNNCTSNESYRQPPSARRDYLGFRVAVVSSVI